MYKHSQNSIQTQMVLARFEEAGYVDNVWCFNNHILRLAVIIYRLRSMGYEIRVDKHSKTDHNAHYYIISKPTKLSPYEVLHGVNSSDTI